MASKSSGLQINELVYVITALCFSYCPHPTTVRSRILTKGLRYVVQHVIPILPTCKSNSLDTYSLAVLQQGSYPI